MLLRLAILLTVVVIGGGARADVRHHGTPAQGRVAVVDLVAAAARRHHVPVPLQLAIVAVESGFEPGARNGAATGLGQIKPGTAHDAGCRGPLAAAGANADCGARILAVLLRDAGGDWRRAAAHYNQGRFARGRRGARATPRE